MADEATNHDGDGDHETTDADKSKEKKHDSGAADLVRLSQLKCLFFCHQDSPKITVLSLPTITKAVPKVYISVDR